MKGRIVNLLLVFAFVIPNIQGGSIACSSNSDCESLVGPGSECRENGLCNNPFEQGCLFGKLPGWTKKRVCNSDDPPNAAALGICRTPYYMDYMELRIYSNNWESAFFEAWILQVILSELLDVPTTIETGTPDAKLNLYDPESPFDYGDSDDIVALDAAFELGDCRDASRDPDYYQPCAHVSPEGWETDTPWVRERVFKGNLEPPQLLGVLGKESWFVTKFTAENDPTLTSFLGMQGEANRRKLAETFLRPTTWKEYCDVVSVDNCATEQDDGVARRAPVDESEYHRMFVQGLYTGHFRATEQNDCDANPSNCTGHIADYPCGWSSYVESQTHYLDIALRSDGEEPGSRGYSYSQLTEMWAAANATKSNLMMFWWTPDPTYQMYFGTDAEFQRVMMPAPSQECTEARVETTDRCSDVLEDRIGEPAGTCEDMPNPLTKMISGNLFELTNAPSIPAAVRSPGYEALQLFKLSQLHLGEIFDYWIAEPSPREAVCKWIVDNMDYMNTFVPNSYPRVVQEDNHKSLLITTTILGSITTVLVLFTAWKVHCKRKERVIRYAQIEFLWLLLSGSLTIAVGAIVSGAAPTDGTCLASIWLINIGYTLELVPLIVKVAGINRMMAAARKWRRVVVSHRTLFGAVLLISFLLVVFLLLWSILDPPGKETEYKLTDEITDYGGTVVTSSFYCSSESKLWEYMAVGWNTILLFCASVIAFQTRNLQQKFNESQTLAILIYSHFMFVVLRVITFALSDHLSEFTLKQARSLIFSIDTIATMVIYFAPKLAASDTGIGAASSHFFHQQRLNSSVKSSAPFFGIKSQPTNQNKDKKQSKDEFDASGNTGPTVSE